jgi:hypothetical protein
VGTGRRYRGGLVDLGTGLISREIFVNEEIYAEELERVFPRAWLFVDFLRQYYYIRYSGPAGLTEQDDMENWNYAHAASRGTIARRYPYTYEQGMGFEVENYEWDGLRLPGSVMDITEAKSSEHNLRNLHRRWAEFMDAESWDELATWRTPAR